MNALIEALRFLATTFTGECTIYRVLSLTGRRLEINYFTLLKTEMDFNTSSARLESCLHLSRVLIANNMRA